MKPKGFITKSLESEVTIYMALFKILKGPEAALPTAKKEGWAYVTNEGNFYVDISDTLRVKINSNADFSSKAENDSSNHKKCTSYQRWIYMPCHRCSTNGSIYRIVQLQLN